MGNDRVLAIDNFGIVPALVEHAGIDTKDIGEVNRSVKCPFIWTDDDQMILVNDQIFFGMKQSFHELNRRGDIVEAP